MKKRSLFTLTAILALTTTGCSQLMGDPTIHQNPDPRQRYEITINIDGAPGPFEAVNGRVQFDIVNPSECAPRDPISGATPTPDYYADIALTKVGENRYRGFIHLDLVRDENYYGKGVCHWRFSAVGVQLKNNGVLFLSGIGADATIKGREHVEYFQKRFYFGSRLPDMVVGGESSMDEAKRRDEYFTINIVATDAPHG